MELVDVIEGYFNRLFQEEIEILIYHFLHMIPDREFYSSGLLEKRFRDYQLDIAGLVQENRTTRGRVGSSLKFLVGEYEKELRLYADVKRRLILFDILVLETNHLKAETVSILAVKYRLEERIRQFKFDDFVFMCRRSLD
ncbi:hypothetical protein [Streptococcus ferus]|uniref:hypothetical protein n=1 Tax=Streptococcus ferus TaxID=1345 RepID=UPI0035A006DC